MTNPRSAGTALRVLGALNVVFALASVVSTWRHHQLRAAMTITFDGPPVDMNAVFESYRRFNQLMQLVNVAGVALTLAALVLLVKGRMAGRALAIAALAFAAVHAVGLTIAYLAKPEAEPSFTLRMVWFVNPILDFAAYGFALFSVARPARKGLAATFVACAVAAVAVLFPLVLARMKDPGETAFNVMLLGYGVAHAVFGVAAFLVAPHAGESTTAPPAGDGAPLRLLGWSYLTRIVAGVFFAMVLLASVKGGDAELAPAITSLGTLVSGSCAVAALVALARYGRGGSSGAVVLAMGTIAFSIVVEVWSSIAATELLTLVAQAKKASSFWNMPSMAKLEELQDTVRYATGFQLLAGVIVTVSLATAFRATARALERQDLADRAVSVMTLSFLAGVTVLATAHLATQKKPGAEVVVAGLAAFVLAVGLFVSWMKLIFGLADALDARRAVPLPADV